MLARTVRRARSALPSKHSASMRLSSSRSTSSARTSSTLPVDAAEADLFVLQELAERCTGDHGLPALLITLQHMAFDDYVRGASALQRREWGKVQGRFEDISFVESAEQSLRLVAGAFEPPARDDTFLSGLGSLGRQPKQRLVERLGLARFLPGGDCDPCQLLPAASHDAAGLAGDVRAVRPARAHPLQLPDKPRATFGRRVPRHRNHPGPVAHRWDLTGSTTSSSRTAASSGSRHAARLAEIDTKIRETTGLADEQRNVLKVVGILNVLSQGGPLRASVPVIRYALSATLRVRQSGPKDHH